MTIARRFSATRLASVLMLIGLLTGQLVALETSTHDLVDEQAVLAWKDDTGNNVLDAYLNVRAVGADDNGVFIDLENTSDELLEGVVEIYARYQAGTPQEQRRRIAVLNGGQPISLDA